MAIRFNTIQIGSTYLSSTGAESGILCKTEIGGLSPYSLDYQGVTVVALDGTPFVQRLTPVIGVPISIKVLTIPVAVFNSIRVAINASLENATSIIIKISGATGDFMFTTLPFLPTPVEFDGDFYSDRIFNATLKFIVQSSGHYIAPQAGVYAQVGSVVTLTT